MKLSVIKLHPSSGRTCGHVTKSDANGAPLTLCNKPAKFDIESIPYCAKHADAVSQ